VAHRGTRGFWSDAVHAFFRVVTTPLVAVPVLIQFFVVTGLVFFALLGSGAYVGAVTNEGTPFYALVYALFFLFDAANPNGQAIPPPEAFTDSEGLANALAGALTPEFLGFAMLIGVFALLVAAVSAYTRSMVVTLAKDEKARFLDLFRGARQYWARLFIVFAPTAILIAAFIVTSIPIFVMNVFYAINGAEVPFSGWIALRIGIIVLLVLYLVLTTMSDGVVARGGRGIRDSVSRFFTETANSFATFGLLLGILFVMLVLESARATFSPTLPVWGAYSVFIVFLALFVVWRVWTTFFVVHRTR
jgi:hypothetical protein